VRTVRPPGGGLVMNCSFGGVWMYFLGGGGGLVGIREGGKRTGEFLF